MRAILVVLLGIGAVAVNGDRIVGGSTTTISQYPYGVALLSAFLGSNHRQSCGGTIINNRSILTAAHCFNFLPNPSQWRSRVGSTNANSGGTVYLTSQIIRHPQYSIATSDADIALLRVQVLIGWVNNAVAAGSIAGANYNLGDNQVVWAIGWGTTSWQGSPSEQLRHVQIWTINQNICAQRYASMRAITPNMLCSGYLDVGGRDQCQGDSGGPLIHNGVVVGVCSWGNQCAHPNFPGVNARVSTVSNWIVGNA